MIISAHNFINPRASPCSVDRVREILCKIERERLRGSMRVREGETAHVSVRERVNGKEEYIPSECRKYACVQERRTIDRGAAMKRRRGIEEKYK